MGTPPSSKSVDDGQVQAWAKEFEATEMQVHEAISVVGTDPGDIEMP